MKSVADEEQSLTMSVEDLLASMQALLIYIMMRLMDGPTGKCESGGKDDVGPQLLLAMEVSVLSEDIYV
jgi:hypothetical protein